AHSNIGGGYENDLLAHFPLEWMISQCENLGLVFRSDRRNVKGPQIAQLEPLLTSTPSKLPEIKDDGPHVRDSFAEFGGILWQHILRVKREYRQIAPLPELRHGKLMQSVNETVDGSIFALVQSTSNKGVAYLPPNLWEYCARHNKQCGNRPTHIYACGIGWGYLALWVIGIFFGGYALGELIDRLALSNLGDGPLSWFWPLVYALGEVIDTLAVHKPKDRPFAWLLGAGVALFALFVDWRESVLNHQVALEPNGPRAERRMAWAEVCLFFRLVAITLFVLGLGAFCLVAWRCPWLWRSPSWDVGWLLVFGALWLSFLAVKSWGAVPMNDAGVGSIVKLQLQTSSENVLKYLVRCAAGERNIMGRHLLAPVARSIWRDIFGFIPIYSLLLFMGSWAALSWLEPGEKVFGFFSSGWPLTRAAILAVACAVADWMEDAIHLHYLKTFPNKPSQILVWLATGLTWIKFLLFGIGILATTAVTLWLALREIWLTFAISESGSGLGLLSAALALLVLLSAVIESRSSTANKKTAEEAQGAVREPG
ncbi:MAG TPA: hypothetical protein VFY83_06125, partial [Anaerolineales bacterium]|nr:hypothetical protein [Anaerolineales bacterium]